MYFISELCLSQTAALSYIAHSIFKSFLERRSKMLQPLQETSVRSRAAFSTNYSSEPFFMTCMHLCMCVSACECVCVYKCVDVCV
jgi:hypothetical protein